MSYKVISGVYVIKNIQNGKLYVGSSINIYSRWATHKTQLRNNSHPNLYLQRVWNKYGEASFRFQILLICEPEKVVLYEQKAIDKFDAFKNGYNGRPKAENCLGVKHSEESKKKRSERMKGNHNCLGKKMPKSWVDKLIARNMGNKNTLGKKMPPQWVKKLIARSIGNTYASANKGIKRCPETLKRMSAAQNKRYERERLEISI